MQLTALFGWIALRARIYLAQLDVDWLESYCDDLFFNPEVEPVVIAEHLVALANARDRLAHLKEML